MACDASPSTSFPGSRRLVLGPEGRQRGSGAVVQSCIRQPHALPEDVQPWKKGRCRLPLRATWQPQDT